MSEFSVTALTDATVGRLTKIAQSGKHKARSEAAVWAKVSKKLEARGWSYVEMRQFWLNCKDIAALEHSEETP